MLSRAARQRIVALDAPRNRGSSPRWWIHYNLLTLRMISFGMDLHWRRSGAEDAQKPGDDHPRDDHRTSTSRPRREVRYSLGEYLAFVTYPPLYLAGPTCTFTAFASQLRRPGRRMRDPEPVRLRGTRQVAGVLLILEVWTHHLRERHVQVEVWQWGAGGGVRRVRAVRGGVLA